MLRQFLLASSYVVSGWFGLTLPFVGTHITLIWLPTGIAVAGLIGWGRSVWPGIYLGAFLVNLITGSSWPLAAAIAVGNTLAPLITVMLLRRLNFHQHFDRQKDVGLLVLATVVGMMFSALGGVVSLYLAGELSDDQLGFALLSWWMGDAIGVLLAAPFLMTLSWDNLRYLSHVRLEWLLWMLVAVTVAWFALIHDYGAKGHSLPLAFLTIPLLTWSGLRFGNTGATLAGLGFSLMAAWGTAIGQGGFILTDVRLSLFLLWAYMATTVLTGLIITALQAERLKIEKALRMSSESLKDAQSIANIGSWRFDFLNHALSWSDEIFRLFELEAMPSVVTYKMFLKVVHPEDRAAVRRAYSESLTSRMPYEIGYRLRMADGRIKWVCERCRTDYDLDGRPMYSQGTLQDVTDLKFLQLELERQAHIDYLTEVSNRRHFMAQAELELSRSLRYGKPLSIFMIDIDYFKKINDSHGHKTGDAVLKKLADVCLVTLREVDIVGRLGGEEFAVLLPETETANAVEAAERLMTAVAEVGVPLENGLPIHFTISIGVASLTSELSNIEMLLHCADKALYQAKESGRNKVCCYAIKQPSVFTLAS